MVLALVVGGAYYFQQQNQGEPSQGNEAAEQNQQQEENPSPGLIASAVVLYTDSGFVPQIFIVQLGETVTFVNGSTSPMWPATAVHPTHQVYPGSDINKCNTAEEKNIFDACGGIEPNQEWSFTFEEKGSWGYHDHLNPSRRGTIVVE
ncbi:MAG: hypothetical protein A2842_01305 [Candidatus Wildermuthbacteria bacterium RIFCSPHIGHO2_01_FULL_48_25]|uniref:EfeO-type cupredoxin-like domain-containing protein n=1 Tax=Candidatus Wildermuthbacteria bacterium RIFCSPLOWO2_01_FULL_48_16 TaxID=1802461 RepID=A0A1G2RLD4_9BACT|nr:MAG: hypothetical protein A2842_01305 [Candidatus Wildermuthbacteria bacterium RIFCSPHIGHO2_01_FULL_48_25]OHA68350.1 MAG: hypothetical protein A3J57_02805 [Candidatus Wildermuthbacteria bacterium RIFCSPHIGHO2_02_FULL_49_12b]OHA73675.1 MAG: hypothetical protein A3B24_02010 [Candidatus Wildermuthbacteria bacterium RIFCSPLOWO2_01_FULL_48_16]